MGRRGGDGTGMEEAKEVEEGPERRKVIKGLGDVRQPKMILCPLSSQLRLGPGPAFRCPPNDCIALSSFARCLHQ